MKKFNIYKDILYAIDLTGVSIINKSDLTNVFLKYPEAAVWLILAEGYNQVTSIKMLQAVLKKNEKSTNDFIDLCISNWKQLNLIH